MAGENFMDKFRMFFGLRPQPPRNDFRNPIWGSDDDDDGDELYTRQQNMEVYSDMEIHREITKHMHDILKSFGGMFGDMKSFFQDDNFDFTTADVPPDSENINSNSIRDYYLKPGYHNKSDDCKDIDLDGKISSQEISGLLNKKNDKDRSLTPFDGSLVPGRSFCKTIITTSVTKADGTVETRRIIKNGNEVVEETTTSEPDARGNNPGSNVISTSIILPDLASLFKNFY